MDFPYGNFFYSADPLTSVSQDPDCSRSPVSQLFNRLLQQTQYSASKHRLGITKSLRNRLDFRGFLHFNALSCDPGEVGVISFNNADGQRVMIGDISIIHQSFTPPNQCSASICQPIQCKVSYKSPIFNGITR